MWRGCAAVSLGVFQEPLPEEAKETPAVAEEAPEAPEAPAPAEAAWAVENQVEHVSFFVNS